RALRLLCFDQIRNQRNDFFSDVGSGSPIAGDAELDLGGRAGRAREKSCAYGLVFGEVDLRRRPAVADVRVVSELPARRVKATVNLQPELVNRDVPVG